MKNPFEGLGAVLDGGKKRSEEREKKIAEKTRLMKNVQNAPIEVAKPEEEREKMTGVRSLMMEKDPLEGFRSEVREMSQYQIASNLKLLQQNYWVAQREYDLSRRNALWVESNLGSEHNGKYNGKDLEMAKGGESEAYSKMMLLRRKGKILEEAFTEAAKKEFFPEGYEEIAFYDYKNHPRQTAGFKGPKEKKNLASFTSNAEDSRLKALVSEKPQNEAKERELRLIEDARRRIGLQ